MNNSSFFLSDRTKRKVKTKIKKETLELDHLHLKQK